MSNQLTSINFHGQAILSAQQDGIIYTAIKPICENIGLAWNAQLERIKRDEVLNSTIRIIRMVANDGKNREMLCLPIHYLNGWLFGVDTNRVKAEIKETLITYKKNATKPYLITGITVWRSIHEQPKTKESHWCER